MTSKNLPPLPAADHVIDVALGAAVFTEDGYTAAQMREYARAAWDAGRKHGQGDTLMAASPWRQIDSAPLSDPLVVWQGGDWVLAECSEYRGWCDLQGFQLDPQPTHWMPIPPLPEPKP